MAAAKIKPRSNGPNPSNDFRMDALGVYVYAGHFCFRLSSVLDSQQHDHFYTQQYMIMRSQGYKPDVFGNIRASFKRKKS